MAGPVAHRELSASRRRDVRFHAATATDDTDIRRLLRENPMAGAISLSLEREPDYFLGTGIAHANDQTILARENDRLVCMGRCTTRARWLDGAVKQVGYLGELRLDASARGRVDLLRRGYDFFRETHAANPADFHFTSIAADNHRARGLLECARRGLPRYTFLSEFVTLLIPVPRRAPSSAPHFEIAGLARLEELVAFLNAQASRHHLAAAWTSSAVLDLRRHGLALENFQLMYEGGRIVACGAPWDQRAFRQTVIRRYSRALSFSRPVLNAAAALFGCPRLPATGTTLAHAFLSPLAVESGREAVLPAFVESFFPAIKRRGGDFLTLGFPARDPALPLLRRHFHHRAYHSRLYQVSWRGDGPPLNTFEPRSFFPEIALL